MGRLTNARGCFACGLILLMTVFNGMLSAMESVDAGKSHTNVMPHVCFLEDAEKTLDFDRFEALQKAGLCDLKSSAGGFAFSSSAYWLRFRIDNSGATRLRRLLAFEPTWLDRIDVAVTTPSGRRHRFRGGDIYPYNTRAFQHPRTVFALELEPGVSTVSVRLETRDPFVVVMELWDAEAFYAEEGWNATYFGLLYGVLLAMMIYNLFLYFSIRERTNLFYVLYIATFIVMNFTYSGFSFPYLWPESPVWGNWAHSVLIYLFTLSGLLFATVFLETKQRLPDIHRWVVGYMGLVSLFFVLTIFTGGYAHHVVTSIFFVVPFSLIAFLLGVVSWLRGNRTARFFILGTTAGLIGASITALTVSSILPFTFYTYRAVDIGMLFDAMFLSLALADRYRILRRERDALRFREIQHEEELLQKEAFAHALENRVQEELEKNSQQEKVMLKQYQQAALGNMIGVIAHQLKQPLNTIGLYMQDMAESYRVGELTSQSVEKMQKSVWDRIVFMSQTIDDFRNYFRPDKESKPFVLQDAIGKVVSLLERQIEARDITIDVAECSPIRIISHENELQQVLLNLIGNAFDALSECHIEEPRVVVSLKEEGGKAVIAIEDNGGGIADEVLPHLFEIYYTTKGEAGTGLGLYMSKMIVTESLGGEITVENGTAGARFVIYLPLT